MARVKLSVRGVSKSFETDGGELEAIKNISFEVGRGEFVVLLGPSGCGKSTLLHILAGLEQATQGETLLDGLPVKGPGRERGMVFQSYTSFPWLTVRKNVEFALRPAGLLRNQRERIAQYYVDLVGLSQFENYLPRDLSGGMRQRVALARSLAAQPSVLLFDEPFGALDAQTRAQMQEELQKILREGDDITAVFVTHDVEEAVFLADRIILLSRRPAVIREVVQISDREIEGQKIEAARYRDPEFKSQAAFLSLRRKIESSLRQEVMNNQG